jgi:tRNA A37 threonylcarbamoyladenosine dehydratase
MADDHNCGHELPPGASARPSLADNEAEETRYRLHRRFDRLGRLYGDGAVARLMAHRVLVIGLGGVGSFAAEALARSAVGHVTLVDFDDVCITNSNRQLQALHGNVGKPKAWILRDRLRLINPQARIDAKRAFYNAARADEMLMPPGGRAWSFVVDCIDNLTAKAHLLAECRKRSIPVVSSMGAAGKLDPTRIRIADLADTVVDPLAREMRKILRTKYAFPSEGPMGITAVSSNEKRQWPKELTYDQGGGFACVCPKGDALVEDVRANHHSCDDKTLIDGTAVFVTGAFGLACAAHVVNSLTADLMATAPLSASKPPGAQRLTATRALGRPKANAAFAVVESPGITRAADASPGVANV